MATIDDFLKLDIRIGTVRNAEPVENSNKLLKLEIDFGEDELRVILVGIAKYYEPEALVGKQMPFVSNLEPKKMGELESRGMMLAADEDGRPILLYPEAKVRDGTRVR